MSQLSVTISLKIPKSLKKKVEWLADLKGLTVSEYIRLLIERELPDEEDNNTAKTHPLVQLINDIDLEDEQIRSFADDLMSARSCYLPRSTEEF